MELNKYKVIRGSLIPHSVEKKIFEEDQKNTKTKMFGWIKRNALELISILVAIVFGILALIIK